jgi:hypothetical protein
MQSIWLAVMARWKSIMMQARDDRAPRTLRKKSTMSLDDDGLETVRLRNRSHLVLAQVVEE